MILCRRTFAKAVDREVFPGIQGGPLLHVIAAKALALGEALEPAFIDYQRQILKNTARLGARIMDAGYRLVSGGTDTHLVLIDLRNKHLDGGKAETALDKAGITANKNTIPFDPARFPATSGLRLGAAALTTRGMVESDMDEVAEFVISALHNHDDDSKLKKIRERVSAFIKKFPLYPGLQY
jgi:glycine hydroxymethyltransferase